MCVMIPDFANPIVDVFGYYFPVDENINTIGFKYFQLDSLAEENTGLITGVLHINEGEGSSDLEIQGTLKGTTLKFKTKPYNGESYSFSGDFKRLGDLPVEQPTDKDMLCGSLRVIKNKMVIRQSLLMFRYEAGD